jgi:methionyl-tRNA synthetase
MNKYYITTAIDYTNDVIHIGHAYQKILADSIARYHRQIIGNKNVFFLTGTDEHGQKVQKSAEEKGIDPKKYVDQISEKDRKEWEALNISYSRFIRTTDEDHKKFSQEFYLKVKKAGYIYPSKYEGLYCEGCEAYIEESELIDGKCPFHPTKTPIKLSEESYFFALSKFQKFLEDHIIKHPEFVQPDSKRSEILSFIKQGLRDFSITRQNVTWGIPVPDNPELTIYVWFDALINYLTYGVEENCWPATVHVLGKDNQRFHAIYWPAMLKASGYELPKTILVHDFISLDGQKISKSLGNVILLSDLVKQFGTDAVRYYFLRYGPLRNDVDISIDKIKTIYNADLANGLGNLVARVARLCEKVHLVINDKVERKFFDEVQKNIAEYEISNALVVIWDQQIKFVDKNINETEPWKITDERELKVRLKTYVNYVLNIAYNLQPFLPETARKIRDQFTGEIKSSNPLFPRLQ